MQVTNILPVEYKTVNEEECVYGQILLTGIDKQMWLPSNPGQPRNTTGQIKWEPWLSSGQLYLSVMKMERHRNTTRCQSWAT